MNIKAASIHRVPIIEKLGNKTAEEIIQMYTKSMGDFLKAIADNKGFDNIIESYARWKKNNYNLSPVIHAADIMTAYEIRRDVLTDLITTYVDNRSQYRNIREEIDSLFLIAKKTGMSYLKRNEYEDLTKTDPGIHLISNRHKSL